MRKRFGVILLVTIVVCLASVLIYTHVLPGAYEPKVRRQFEQRTGLKSYTVSGASRLRGFVYEFNGGAWTNSYTVYVDYVGNIRSMLVPVVTGSDL